MNDRPWYQPHWVWLAAVPVLTAVAVANCASRGPARPLERTSDFGFYARSLYGWPWLGLAIDDWNTWSAAGAWKNLGAQPTKLHGRWLAVLADAAVALALIVGTVAAMERCIRGRWGQFSLMGLLITAWTVAALLVLYEARDLSYLEQMDVELSPGGFFGALPELPWFVGGLVIFCLACTLQTAGWLVVWASTRLLQAVSPGRRRLAA